MGYATTLKTNKTLSNGECEAYTQNSNGGVQWQ
jgi:hypothetical protein